MIEPQVMDKQVTPKITGYQKDDIIHRLALQETQRSIAKVYNITQPSVCEINKANAAKIAKVKEVLVAENIEDIRQAIRDDVVNNKAIGKEFKVSTNNITAPKVAYKATVQKNIINPLLQKIDIFPSNTMGNHIGDIIQNNTVVSPAFQSYIDYQSNNPEAIDTKGDMIDDDN